MTLKLCFSLLIMRHYLSQLSNVTYELLSVEAEYKREEEEGTEKG